MPTVRLQIRRKNADEWTELNPALLNGEFGLEQDTGYIKIGFQSKHWNDLPYINQMMSSEKNLVNVYELLGTDDSGIKGFLQSNGEWKNITISDVDDLAVELAAKAEISHSHNTKKTIIADKHVYVNHGDTVYCALPETEIYVSKNASVGDIFTIFYTGGSKVILKNKNSILLTLNSDTDSIVYCIFTNEGWKFIYK